MKYKYIGTEEQLIEHGFVDGDMSYSHGAYHTNYGFTRVAKDFKTKTLFVAIITRISVYNIEQETTKNYKSNRIVIIQANKRRNYGGYMWGSYHETQDDITPYIQDLIDANLVEVIA